MANVKITQLPQGTPQLTDQLCGVDTTGTPTTKKFLFGDQVDFIGAMIQNQDFTYGLTTGTSTAYAVTITPTISALQRGQLFLIEFHVACGSSPTINIDGLGAVPLVDQVGAALTANAIPDANSFGLIAITNGGAQAMLITLYPAGGGGGITPQQIQNQAFTYGASAGTGTAYTVSFSPNITSLADGQLFLVQFNTACGNAPTIDIDGVGPIPIVDQAGDALTAGAIPTGGSYGLIAIGNSGAAAMLITQYPIGGVAVSPQEVQAQTFTYAADSSTGPNAYVADFTPDMQTSNGTRFDVKINATGTNTTTNPTITADGNSYNIFLNDGAFGAVAVGDILANSICSFELTGGNAVLLNPATTITGGVTPDEIQNQTFTFSVDSGIADAYVGSYSPAPAPVAGTTLELKIANANATINPTFDAGDGPHLITLGNGDAVGAGDLAVDMVAVFIYDGTNWQLTNPALSGGSFPEEVITQQVSVGAAPFTYNSGANQVLIFDSIMGNGIPNLYNSTTGTFTLPTSGTWLFNFTGLMTGNSIDALRLVLTSSSADLQVNYPVVNADGTTWSIACVYTASFNAAAELQFQFDASASGQFENGSGGDQYYTTTVQVTRLDSGSSNIPFDTPILSVAISGQQVVGASTTTPIEYDTIISDTHSTFDTGTYTFTAPFTGYYAIGQAVTVNWGSSTTPQAISLVKNGVTTIKNGATSNQETCPALVGNFYAQSGDTFQITIQNLDPSNSVTINPGQPATYWDIFYIANSNTTTTGDGVRTQQISLASNLSYSAGNGQILQYDAIVGAGISNLYDTSTGTFTAPVTGTYLIQHMGQNTTGTVDKVYFYLPDFAASSYLNCPSPNSRGTDTSLLENTFSMSAGTKFQIRFDATGSGDFIAGAGAETYYVTVINVSILQTENVNAISWLKTDLTSVAADPNAGYVIGNAAQTTVLLPSNADAGQIVMIQGLGAGGWILQANTGQTINIGQSATSSGGTVTSAAANDAIVVVCVTANTTWAMQSAVTSGFTIA